MPKYNIDLKSYQLNAKLNNIELASDAIKALVNYPDIKNDKIQVCSQKMRMVDAIFDVFRQHLGNIKNPDELAKEQGLAFDTIIKNCVENGEIEEEHTQERLENLNTMFNEGLNGKRFSSNILDMPTYEKYLGERFGGFIQGLESILNEEEIAQFEKLVDGTEIVASNTLVTEINNITQSRNLENNVLSGGPIEEGFIDEDNEKYIADEYNPDDDLYQNLNVQPEEQVEIQEEEIKAPKKKEIVMEEINTSTNKSKEPNDFIIDNSSNQPKEPNDFIIDTSSNQPQIQPVETYPTQEEIDSNINIAAHIKNGRYYDLYDRLKDGEFGSPIWNPKAEELEVKGYQGKKQGELIDESLRDDDFLNTLFNSYDGNNNIFVNIKSDNFKNALLELGARAYKGEQVAKLALKTTGEGLKSAKWALEIALRKFPQFRQTESFDISKFADDIREYSIEHTFEKTAEQIRSEKQNQKLDERDFEKAFDNCHTNDQFKKAYSKMLSDAMSGKISFFGIKSLKIDDNRNIIKNAENVGKISDYILSTLKRRSLDMNNIGLTREFLEKTSWKNIDGEDLSHEFMDKFYKKDLKMNDQQIQGKRLPKEFKDLTDESYNDALATYGHLKAIHDTRGRFFWLFHPYQNSAEKQALQDMKTTLMDRGIFTPGTVDSLSEKWREQSMDPMNAAIEKALDANKFNEMKKEADKREQVKVERLHPAPAPEKRYDPDILQGLLNGKTVNRKNAFVLAESEDGLTLEELKNFQNKLNKEFNDKEVKQTVSQKQEEPKEKIVLKEQAKEKPEDIKNEAPNKI